MNKQKDKNQHSLHLAVAAATLGMSMGINPDTVLASPTLTVPLSNEDAGVAHEPLRLAAEYMDSGNTGFQAEPQMDERPGLASPEVKQPGVRNFKFFRPGTAFPKVEQPGVQFPKVEQPLEDR
jgi:hypothetical protein